MEVETEEPVGTAVGESRGRRRKRILVRAAVVVIAFLLGLVPMWLSSREKARELASTNSSLRSAQLHNLLGDAAVDARRGDYEPARQEISKFFTDLHDELGRSDSAFTEQQRARLEPLLADRDDLVTLLARSDVASGGRLADLHAAFRQALAAESTPVK